MHLQNTKIPKQKTLSAQEVVDEMMQWVEDRNPDDGEIEEDDDNLDELNGNNDDDDDDVEDNVDPDDVASDGYLLEDDVRPAGPVRWKCQRKKLTHQPDFYSIDSALNENNYNLYVAPTPPILVTAHIPDPSDPSKKRKLPVQFSTEKPVQVHSGRQRWSGVLPNTPGLSSAEADHATTPEKAFSVFFSNVMIAHIGAITNRKIETTTDYLRAKETTDFTKFPHVKEVRVIELKAFFDFLFYRGLYGLTKHSTNILVSDKHGAAVFLATMSRFQFEFLLSHICFDEFKVTKSGKTTSLRA